MDVHGVPIFVGTATKDGHILLCNPVKQTLKHLSSIEIGNRPMFAVSAPHRRVITVSQDFGDESGTGALVSIALEKETYQPSIVSKVSCAGKGPCHVGLSHDARFCFVANYESGHIASFAYDARTGQLSADPVSVIRQGPEGYTNQGRQDGPHPHQVVISCCNSQIYVCDLGTNVVNRFSLSANGEMAFIDALSLRDGAGPRHLAFHPFLPVAYILHELDNGCTVVDVDEQGALSIKQVVECVPEVYDAPPPFEFYTRNSHAAEVLVSKDGSFVLCTNRGYDAITVFNVKPKTGELEVLNYSGTRGALPWHAAFISHNALLTTTQFDKDLKTGGAVEMYGFDTGILPFITSLPISHPLCAIPVEQP
eukprot:m.128728 g.128728  ORF g.128728 m.128728 type:complete len:366 (+) comp15677_c3_seq2:189-1286(+)